MSEAAALNTRKIAASTLSEASRQLTNYKLKHNPSKRLLIQKLKKVEDAKEELMIAHFHYSKKSGKDLKK